MRRLIRNIIPFLICLTAFLIPFIFREQMWGTMARANETIETQPKYEELPLVDMSYWVDLGEFTLTAYDSCEVCCGKWAKNRPTDENGNEIVIGAIGERLKSDYSIAVDKTVIPYGSTVLIGGKEYKAQDCGGAIKGKKIDVFHDDHASAREFGRKSARVFILKEVEKMSYQERLKEFEREKQNLLSKGLSIEQYEKAIRQLAKKWRV